MKRYVPYVRKGLSFSLYTFTRINAKAKELSYVPTLVCLRVKE
jgi:hypothetical protein